MLHIINKSPYTKSSLESCIRVANSGDPILLIEDAVLGANAGGSAAALVKEAQKSHDVYAISADVKARGLDKLVDGVKVIDYTGFVELVEQHRTMTWLQMPPLRETMAGLLVRKEFSAVLGLARSDRRALRTLMGLLFHEDGLIRWRAVSMFGRMALEEPEIVRPQLFKLYYSLSEESSVVGWGSAQAIGEIARVNPELAREVIRPVVHFMDDEEVSLPANRNTVQLAGTIWAIGNIADTLPELSREMGPRLEEFLSDPDTEVRGLSVWAICRSRYRPTAGKLEKMLDDTAALDIYSSDELIGTTVGSLAGKAIDRMQGNGTSCL